MNHFPCLPSRSLTIQTNAVQLILYTFLGPETLYIRGDKDDRSQFQREYTHFRRIDHTPLRLWDFIQPLSYFGRPCVVIPAAAYAMVFLWGSITITIEIPQVFPEKFGFNTQQVGLQFLGVIIGSVIGEQVGGLMSDQWMWRRQKRTGVSPPPEFRLWLSYIGHGLTVCGVVVFAVQIGQASSTWNITPIIGAAIASAGNQIVTTVNITYAVDCYKADAASIGVFITACRQIFGFAGPFW